MFGTVKLLECIARTGIPIGELYDTYEFPEMESLSVSCSWEKKGRIMRQLIETTETMNRELIDGVKILQEEGWTLVMPEADSARFTIISESYDREFIHAELQRWKDQIEDWKQQN